VNYQLDSWSCFGCCAAMAAGQTLKNFTDFVGHDGSGWSSITSHPEHREGFSIWEVISYLAFHEIMLGTYGIHNEDEKFFTIDKESSISFDHPTDRPAIIGVRSERLHPNVKHVIFWDGKKVYDPYKETKKKKLKEYKILEWFPLLYEYK
jgi:hypothetical protein